MPVANRSIDCKRCPKCVANKPLDDFGLVKGKRRSYCRKCHAAANLVPDLRSEKRCPSCKETKAVSEFNRLGERYQSTCRECRNVHSQVRRAEEKDAGLNVEINRRDYQNRRRWASIKCKYGLTKEQYLQMIEDQKNLCAICGKPETETSSPHITEMELSVDHCHKTGKVRGLLCRQCNIALGKFQEDISVLQSAVDYLRLHSE